MNKRKIEIFDSTEELIQDVAANFTKASEEATRMNKNYNIALSGGNTPKQLFKYLGKIGKEMDWAHVHFFWGDERCVPNDDVESNYGQAKTFLFDKIIIPEQNIHRIIGENEPEEEAKRYANEINRWIKTSKDNYPVFDWIILGLGEDGHTASIFPGQENIIQSKEICAVAEHPQSGQKRITLTLPVIDRAKKITFLVTGSNKAQVVAEIMNNKPESKNYPAAMVQTERITIEWYLDKESVADSDLIE